MILLDHPTAGDVNKLVRVSLDAVPVGVAATAMGWSDTHSADCIQMRVEELMETEVFVVSNEECEQSAGKVGRTEIFG